MKAKIEDLSQVNDTTWELNIAHRTHGGTVGFDGWHGHAIRVYALDAQTATRLGLAIVDAIRALKDEER